MVPRVFLRCLFLVAACLAALPAAAAPPRLGEADVPVSGQSAPERTRAVAEGFRQVLVKLSGNRAVLASPAIQQELGRGEQLLNAFRYESVPVVPGGDPALAPLRLRLSFDGPSLTALLNRAGAPVWGVNRPTMLVWLERDGSPRLVAGPGQPLADTLVDLMGQRGVPLALPPAGSLPVLAAGQQALPAPVGSAATSASAKVVLAATVGGVPGRWRAAGVLVMDGRSEPLEAGGSDEFAAVRELVALAADRVGSRHAVVARTDKRTPVRLRITGVDSLADCAAVERWLRASPLVKSLDMRLVAPGRVEFDAGLAGELAQLRAALQADNRYSGIVEGGEVEGRGTLEARWAAAGGN